MRTAHLILTYTHPHQTEMMIKKMSHPDFDFYIHVDKKIDIKPYLYLDYLPNVFFIENREDVRWACFNTVKAIFNCIIEICNSGKKYNFINLLSGQDYPIKPVGHLVDFFEKNKGKEFIAHRDIINDWPGAQMRYNRYHLINYRINGRHIFGRHLLEKSLTYLLGKRTMPYQLHPYGESMFWMLSPEVALFVANKVLNDKKLRRFFYFSWASDEFVFQTIIMNSHYKDRVINNNYRYIDWSEKKENPKVLGAEDFSKLKDSSTLFARKFDVTKDIEVLNKLDSIL